MDTSIPNSAPEPLKVGMLCYPGMTLLDLTGPQAVLGMHSETYLIWKTLDPVSTDSGLWINPSHTFKDSPSDLDVLFVPGGYTATDMMGDDETIDFLAKAGASARYVTSVCSGALLLGMAGLLDGYRAATHWAVYDVLEALGVETFQSLRSVLLAQQLEYRCQLHIYQWLLLQQSILNSDIASTGSLSNASAAACLTLP